MITSLQRSWNGRRERHSREKNRLCGNHVSKMPLRTAIHAASEKGREQMAKNELPSSSCSFKTVPQMTEPSRPFRVLVSSEILLDASTSPEVRRM